MSWWQSSHPLRRWAGGKRGLGASVGWACAAAIIRFADANGLDLFVDKHHVAKVMLGLEACSQSPDQQAERRTKSSHPKLRQPTVGKQRRLGRRGPSGNQIRPEKHASE